MLFFIAAGSYADFAAASLLKKVEQRYGEFALNRFKALNELVQRVKNADEKTKLEEINRFWNDVRYRSDLEVWGNSDYWATPWEFLAKDSGDCEDYVIAKYFTLKYVGVSSDKLYFTYVRALKYNKPHMVLTYFAEPDTEPLILDNINYKIFPASKRKDLIPVYSFNGDEISAFKDTADRKADHNKIKIKKRWDRLLENIEKGKI